MNNLDANVVLRYLLKDIPAQEQRSRAVITTSYCYISDVIVTEVIFVLEKINRFARHDIAVLVRQLIALKTVVCSEPIIERSLDLYVNRRQLSFPDCFAATESLLSGDPLLTFDKDLIRHGGTHVKEP